MRVERQKRSLPLQNFDKYILGAGVKSSKHGKLLPNTIRSLIAGPSCAGKTNAVFNLLFDPHGLRFKNVYVFSKSLYQPKYQFLAKTMPKEIGYYAYDDNSVVISPSETKPNSIMIFDDIACEKHDNIRNYFISGRHNDVDIFYIGQSYSRIPKQLIRDNANFIILFKQDDKNLKHVYSDHVSTDFTFEQFRELCSRAWTNKYGFLVISKDDDLNKGRYRIGFDSFILHDNDTNP